MIVFRESGKRGATGGGGYDTASPASKQSTRAIQDELVVVDHDHKLAAQLIDLGVDRSGRIGQVGLSDPGHYNSKNTALAHN